ncbi:hypothetical protein GCM10010214_62100 [Streptomyces abikoensis]|nr:hypothetical protein GCM10010214_62100 [Streptomyces abikoensis]
MGPLSGSLPVPLITTNGGDGPTCRSPAQVPGLLLPAHAGMDPPSTSTPARGAPAPRARGDDPEVAFQMGQTIKLFPVGVGMVPARSELIFEAAPVPCPCGDGPLPRESGTPPICSLRVRGWALVQLRLDRAG